MKNRRKSTRRIDLKGKNAPIRKLSRLNVKSAPRKGTSNRNVSEITLDYSDNSNNIATGKENAVKKQNKL